MLPVNSLKQHYNNEQILVILISRLYFHTQSRSSVIEFTENHSINWNQFYRILKAHTLRSFIYHVIKKENLKIPEDYENKLKAQAFQSGLNSLHQMNMLNSLLTELNQRDIRVIPYKGVTLATSYYDAVALRESLDIDLFVAREDVKKIRRFFYEKKFEPYTDVPESYLGYALRFLKEITFKTPKDHLQLNCTVEIKWKLLDWYKGDFADYHFFSPHLETYSYNNTMLPRLKASYDFLCVATNHLFKEPFFSFKYVVDLACIMHKKGGELDWDLILGPVKAFKAETLFCAGIKTINDLLGVHIGDTDLSVNNKILLNNAIAFPPKNKEAQANAKSVEELLHFDSSAKTRLKRKARIYCYWIIPNLSDINDLKLPAFLMPLLLVYRPLKLLMKFLTKLKK